jgi:hypothetical protein
LDRASDTSRPGMVARVVACRRDYRLVFLLLTLPQLLEWSDDASPLRGWGRTGTALVLAVLYLGPLLAERSLADVFANWALAWVLFAFLAPSVRETVVSFAAAVTLRRG